ncbi:MAG: undecaprenyl-phosphate glucose phosphotransferase [Planctomycetota bacterium]|jgi:putative colanic acid biosynthesis UDP-glucose lipid carrier transferase
MVKRHHKLMLFGLRLGDMGVAVLAWVLAYYMHVLAGRMGWLRSPQHCLYDLLFQTILSLVLMLLIFSRLGLYESKRTKSFVTEAIRIAEGVLLVWVITYAITSFASATKLSRATTGMFLSNWLVLAVLNRFAARASLYWLRKGGWNLRHAAIVGTGRLGQKLYYTLKDNRWTGIRVCYFVETEHRSEKLFGLDVLGPISKVDALVAEKPVDIVFVALPPRRSDDMEQALNRLVMTNADVRVVPDLLSFHFLRHDVTQLDELPIISLTHSPQHGWNSVMKRVFDVIGSALALVVLAIPMGILGLLVGLSSRGGVFYRQQRASLSGKPFTIVKFRTMIQNAETDTGPVWAASDDARVTRIGRFLRRTSLDELPQLFNVLIGQMSLVGPRPERPELIEQFREIIPHYMLRNQVKAGLTGWAQVHGLRGRTSLRKRIQYDLYYVSNWSFALDMWILILTLFRGFIHPHAY